MTSSFLVNISGVRGRDIVVPFFSIFGTVLAFFLAEWEAAINERRYCMGQIII